MTEAAKSTRQISRRQLLQKYPIDGQAAKRLVQAGADWLKTNQQTVNALNVFPVPDGDTGTNMVLTMQSAMAEAEHVSERSVGKVLQAVAQGALMGARGNSGVILSQLWRGFAKALEGEPALTGERLARGFAEASETAYKGVVRPVEGTLLTVSKDVALAAVKALERTNDALEILEVGMAAAAESVERTPELLPILKQAGVVDSGGKGYFFLLEGMVRWVNGERLDKPLVTAQPLAAMNFENTMEAIEEGQDYEVVVDFKPSAALDLPKFYGALEEMGTSIQVGEGDEIYRMHIHVPTEKRYAPIDYVMTLGTVTNVHIENLMAQMAGIGKAAAAERISLTPVEPGQIAVVAVSPGPGISRVFASLGAAALVEGGQTMNPSTQQILSAFENLPTTEVVILPNNKNIVMAALAAAELTVKNVHVIPTRNVPQGLAAMLRLAPNGKLEEIAAEMAEALEEVEAGEVTTATRTVEIDGVEVKEGEVIGLYNGKLVFSVRDLESACLQLMEKMGAANRELITMFYGADVEAEEAQRIADAIRAAYPNQEVEVQNGGQPHYQFIFSVE